MILLELMLRIRLAMTSGARSMVRILPRTVADAQTIIRGPMEAAVLLKSAASSASLIVFVTKRQMMRP